MRLIDADALIQSLKSACTPELCHDCGSNWCEYCCPKNDYIDLIEDAPTVEPFDYVGAERAEARQRGYEEGYHNGMEIGKTLNPKIKQGEWIIDGHHRRCNYCNEYTCTEDREGNSIPDNFCPSCGADMRRGDAE